MESSTVSEEFCDVSLIELKLDTGRHNGLPDIELSSLDVEKVKWSKTSEKLDDVCLLESVVDAGRHELPLDSHSESSDTTIQVTGFISKEGLP